MLDHVENEHTAGWTEERVETLKAMWIDGKSAREIADTMGGGLSRSGVIGKVHRLKLPGRKTDVRPKRTPAQKADDSRVRTTIMRRNGNAGQPKAAAIRHRIAVQPTLPRDPLPSDDGVDVTKLLGLQHLTDKTCRWPVGDPMLPDFGFCGDPTKEGSRYCPKHHRRAYVRV